MALSVILVLDAACNAVISRLSMVGLGGDIVGSRLTTAYVPSSVLTTRLLPSCGKCDIPCAFLVRVIAT